MDDSILATDGGSSLSEPPRRVKTGNEVENTNYGQPMADAIPREGRSNREERERRHHEFLDSLRSRPVMNIGPWTRDELYDDD